MCMHGLYIQQCAYIYIINMGQKARCLLIEMYTIHCLLNVHYTLYKLVNSVHCTLYKLAEYVHCTH